ncbi:hypothetical protein EVAR_44317_1 [Eumeta japonica]|uniref:Uncharacterized protein n=1 Tax=Eumeta variegata TaxID=151549 RepID=A0A4C1XC83_EUMVA|nr:hypothetical protein EVAR_44317_1 [Eumeta japonica]
MSEEDKKPSEMANIEYKIPAPLFLDSIEDLRQKRRKFKQEFQGIGEFKTLLELYIQSGTTPVVKPPRRVPHALMDRLAAKLTSHLGRLVTKNIASERKSSTGFDPDHVELTVASTALTTVVSRPQLVQRRGVLDLKPTSELKSLLTDMR